MILFALSLANAAPAAKVSLCHQDDTGSLNLISISGNAVAAHLANHGDVYPDAYHPDMDGDGYGDTFGATIPCPADGYTLDASDCDDLDAYANPGEEEVCDDEVDNNCDLQIDEDCDSDCPCAGQPAWDDALEYGVPAGYCLDRPGIEVASYYLTDTDFGFIIQVDYAGYCTAYTFNEVGTAFAFTDPLQSEACASQIEAWLDANGAVCY